MQNFAVLIKLKKLTTDTVLCSDRTMEEIEDLLSSCKSSPRLIWLPKNDNLWAKMLYAYAEIMHRNTQMEDSHTYGRHNSLTKAGAVFERSLT